MRIRDFMILEGAVMVLLSAAVVIGWGFGGFDLALSTVMIVSGLLILVCPFVPWPAKGFGVQPNLLTGLAMGGGLVAKGLIAGAPFVGVLVPYSTILDHVTTGAIVIGFISFFLQYSRTETSGSGNYVRTN
jgi:hypothetical protein